MPFFSIKPKGPLQSEYKSFAKSHSRIQNSNQSARRSGTGLLTPDDIYKGKAVKRSGITYSSKDLKEFGKQSAKLAKKFGSRDKKGITPLEIIAESLPIDVRRSNNQVADRTGLHGVPVAYRLEKSIVHFKVNGSSGKSYDVRMRLEEMEDAITDTGKSYRARAKRALSGRVSINCECGRFQYWYRYLATKGGFCLDPPLEFDYPKIRNPKLMGCACKHIIKVAAHMTSTRTVNVIAGEIEKISAGKGYGSDVQRADKFFDEDSLNKLTKTKRVQVDHEKAKASLDKIRTAQENLIKQGKKYPGLFARLKAAAKAMLVKNLNKEVVKGNFKQKEAERHEHVKKAKETTKKVQVDATKKIQEHIAKLKLQTHLLQKVRLEKQNKADALKDFASQNNMSQAEVDKLAQGIRY